MIWIKFFRLKSRLFWGFGFAAAGEEIAYSKVSRSVRGTQQVTAESWLHLENQETSILVPVLLNSQFFFSSSTKWRKAQWPASSQSLIQTNGQFLSPGGKFWNWIQSHTDLTCLFFHSAVETNKRHKAISSCTTNAREPQNRVTEVSFCQAA